MSERFLGQFSALLGESIEERPQLAQQLYDLWQEMVRFSTGETLDSLEGDVITTKEQIKSVLGTAVAPNYKYCYTKEDYLSGSYRNSPAPIMVDEGGDTLEYPDKTKVNAARTLKSITLEGDKTYTLRSVYLRRDGAFDAAQEKYSLTGKVPNQEDLLVEETKAEFETQVDGSFRCIVSKTNKDGDQMNHCFIIIEFSQEGIPSNISYGSFYNGEQVRQDDLPINKEQYGDVVKFVKGALGFVNEQVQSADPLRAKRDNEIQITPTYIHDHASSMIERHRAELQVAKNPFNRGIIINEGLDRMEKLKQKLDNVLSRVDESGLGIPPTLRKKVEEAKEEVVKAMEDFRAKREKITENLKPLIGDCNLTEATRYWNIDHIGKRVILRLLPSSQTPDSRRSLLQIYFQPTEQDKANQALMAQAEIVARALSWQIIDALCERFDFAPWQKMRETRLAVQFGDDPSDIFELPSVLSATDMMIAKYRFNKLGSSESNQEIADRVNRVIGSLNKVREILNLRQHEWTFRALSEVLQQYGFDKDDIDRFLGQMESEGSLKYTTPTSTVCIVNDELLDKIPDKVDKEKRKKFWEEVQSSYDAQRDDIKVKEIEGLGDAIHETAEAWASLATLVDK